MEDFTTTVSVPNVLALTLPHVVTVNEFAKQKHKHDNTKNSVNFILILVFLWTHVWTPIGSWSITKCRKCRTIGLYTWRIEKKNKAAYQCNVKQKKIMITYNFEKFIVSMINAFIITLEKLTWEWLSGVNKKWVVFYGWFIIFVQFSGKLKCKQASRPESGSWMYIVQGYIFKLLWFSMIITTSSLSDL